ncbi:hypothetical protein DH2020_038611 [Rehmannia glutinosa]|uniref:Uncharacterized protein n=1 Tax=Rehmannia glutinosa TaxID=99300 RepID=A0ABR0UZP4_REHGL
MADAAVEFLLENLKQLLLHHAHLIKDAKNQVEKLQNDLRFFKAFLKDTTTKKRKKDETLQVLVRQICDVVYDAEDVIDAFVTQAAEIKSKGYFFRAFMTPPRLLNIAERVETVCRKISDIYGGKDKMDFAGLGIGDGEPDKPEVPVVRQENLVGFEDDAEKIIGYLNEETEQLDVISIIGMPGLGKTTLAGKIYRNPTIQYEFQTRAWVFVSQEFTVKDVFISILKQTNKELFANTKRVVEDKDTKSAGVDTKSVAELAQEIATSLQGKKFLIVMDDVWTADDWDKLQIALPKSSKMGKVLITSRQVEVAWFANRDRPPHNLRFLTQEESWLLLRWEVFRKPECPSELEVLGKQIANNCKGVALAIVVIGGILARKSSSSDEMSARRNAWRKVSERVTTYLIYEDPQRLVEKLISLSYQKLPYHLRECFLYLGMFPEDYEIPVHATSLEETAEDYLDELINRNLVRIDKRTSDGKVKTCRVHDMIHDFCKTEGGSERENFFQEINKSSDGGFQPPVSCIDKYRRVSIHSEVVEFLSSKPSGPRIRSFVCINKDEVNLWDVGYSTIPNDEDEFNLPNENISAIPVAFKLVRVLDAQSIKFSKFPRDLYKLIHLRFIALSIHSRTRKSNILPSYFSKLWNVQTLIVHTVRHALDVEANILSMVQLRHFKTNASTTLRKPGKNSKEGRKLQTLGIISPESCGGEVFDRACNLKKLGICGKLALLLDGKDVSFDSLAKLGNLEKLKLINFPYPHLASEAKLGCLPPAYKFPAKLRSLTLSYTYLDWSHMSILGSLETLEVLKLKNYAFVGDCWVVADVGFRCLEFLHIGRTNLALWVASSHHFSKLRRLELRNCEKLKEIPIGLADIPCLQLLDLYYTKQAAVSARKILEAKNKQEEKAFKLSILPPEDE